MYRTHTCNELSAKDVNQKVTLAGWVNKVRSFGNLVFIDLRDRYGLTQVVCDKDKAEGLKREYVVQFSGTVKKRQEGQDNKSLATGEIEVEASSINVLSESAVIPIDLDNIDNVSEDNRLKYRYLDLRRKQMQDNLITRYKITKVARDYFEKNNFLEIETPILGKSTPEGARDYLVPSRVNKGKFYALPQSPQLFKQILMVSGFDRYLQIVKCFRDEDLRADRQPEFTQIDLEMSFVEEKDVISVMNGFIKTLFKEVKGLDVGEIPTMTYKDAMEKYGSDKPDIRFGLEFIDFTAELSSSEFKVFSGAANGGIKGIFVPSEFSGKQVKKYEEVAKLYKAKGLIALSVGDELEGGILKFLSPSEISLIKSKVSGKGTLFIVADPARSIANEALGRVRLEIARNLELFDKSKFGFVWITEFPLFEWSEEEGRFMSVHHPFTMPHPEDLDKLYAGDLGSVRSLAYDIAINGNEAGGGSIRIHDKKLQAKIFELLGISEEDAASKFGFLLEAFKYGVPPHGGLAFGLDRLAAMMTGNDSIKEVMAFPKNKAAYSPLDEAPNVVDDKQLAELGIKVRD
ncbi:aspartate--tRNA ligase [Candidatus Woesearchaeota archaeon]|nr:aspartate--tRNA ligase [Candidatus Woesearchaeota archaeon]